ncbi:hypothetical protein K501DRAFT_242368 [Backusella circina FSU 941]|nr:hypothetical protein K501DRAFT_242368 [Backusella circina FSU 941]
MHLSHLFIAKNRKVEFELNILIQNLTNVPLVSGFFLVKWRLRNANQTSGTTARSPIRDHTIFWGENINTFSELVISKKQQHTLGPCEFKLEVYQENERELIPIGCLVINLSEYAGSGLTTRRYLLDECKFNSTIKLSIRMNQLSDTDIHYQVPPLKKQQIFTDIPSMITTERQDKPVLFDEKSLRMCTVN